MITYPERLTPGTVAVVGIPFDAFSSFLQGAAKAPAQIRRVMHAGACNLCSESGIDLADRPEFIDLGDMDIDGESNAIESIEATTSDLLNRHIRLISLGGDHAITYPLLKSHYKKYARLEIVHLDAHPDLYDRYDDNRFSHACPFARIMEEKLASRLVQIGIRTLNPHQKQQAERFGAEIITIAQLEKTARIRLQGPLYLSIDLDVLDPAFAPGVAHHEPGGLTTRQLIDLIQHLQAPIVGADIVEYNPGRDFSDITAMVAVKILKEVAARMLEIPPDLA
ncbi:MAG: agmatinase [Deltaproteobacteria bacterium]|jgi:agmatinase|nr:agmatinase [Deltaproteobacteria bacterium]MBW2515557.1 agmatinase [Deltaproteobacteria bacterium]